jgi:hypothetical protein
MAIIGTIIVVVIVAVLLVLSSIMTANVYSRYDAMPGIRLYE